jgi:hypothetical protein
VGTGGRESVDHPKGAHDDIANAVAGVLWKLSPVRRSATIAPGLVVTAGPSDPFGNNLGDTDSAYAWATRHYDEGLIFARPDPGSGSDRFSFGGRGF